MATKPRTAVELERPGGQADVIIVRRLTRPGRPSAIHGAGGDHWTMHYTLAGERSFRIRGVLVAAATDTLLVYRREATSGTPPPATVRWDAMTACFDTAPGQT